MVLSGPKRKSLNKETVSLALLDNFDFSPELVCEIVECVWHSDEADKDIEDEIKNSGELRDKECE